MDEQSELSERPRATVIQYFPVASFLSVARRRTGRLVGPTGRRRRSGSVPAPDPRRWTEGAWTEGA